MDHANPECGGIKFVIAEIYRIEEHGLFIKLQEAVASRTKVRVVLRTPMLEEPHSNLDISDDYYTALIFGEFIAPFCEEIDWEEVAGGHGVESILFTLVPSDAKGLARKLAWYSQAERRFLNPEDRSWTPEYSDVDTFEELRGFNEDMEANVQRFNDLAESYVRNLQVGLSELYDGRELQAVYDDLRVAYRRWWDPSLEMRPLNIDSSRLAQGMTQEEVGNVFGGCFSRQYSEQVGASHVEMVDYEDDDVDDNSCRLWFLHDSLVSWHTGKLDEREFNLRSPSTPDFVKKLREQR